MAKDPAFPFYTQDFLTGTLFFTNEEVGIYIKLLCVQHQHGGLVDKDVFNEQTKNYEHVRRKFIETEDGFYNKRLMEEMIKRQKKSENLSANALKGWALRKQSKSNADVMPPER